MSAPAPAAPADAAEVGRKDLLRVIGAAIVVALPISLVAIGFLDLVDTLQTWVWETAPADLGLSSTPWWWAVPWLLLAGLLVALAVSLLPGRGGHVPANGSGGTPIPPGFVAGVLVAALAGLPFGVVLGPEAPLIGMGTGLAVAISRVVRLSPGGRLEALIGIAGAAAAISIILGSPLTAVVFMAEAVAVTGGPVIAAIVPSLLGVGIGALLFSGLGDNAGITAQSLQLVKLDSVPAPGIGDLLWAVPVGVIAAVVMTVVFTVGQRVAARLEPLKPGRLVAATMGVGLVVAACASAYALITGRSPFDVASSGTATLSTITSDTTAWSSGALIALLLFKSLGYMLSLGSFRGGPIFPSILIGGAFGLLLSPLPGLGVAGGLAVGMAAFAAAGMKMPLSAVALTCLMFGTNMTGVFPEVAVAAVVAYAARVALDKRASASAAVAAEPSAA